MFDYKRAFTLAEVLITLVIIGVISAITVPTIIADSNQKSYEARAKKVYSTLANAMTMAKANGADFDFEVANDSNKNMKDWYDKYLKSLITMKTCYDKMGCWHKGDTKGLDGKIVYYNRPQIGVGANIITAVLNDGSFINIDAYGKASIYTYFGTRIDAKSGLVVFFDVNGEKKPNVLGKDIYVVVFSENGVMPAWKDKTAAERNKDCSNKGQGYSCLNNVLRGERAK